MRREERRGLLDIPNFTTSTYLYCLPLLEGNMPISRTSPPSPTTTTPVYTGGAVKLVLDFDNEGLGSRNLRSRGRNITLGSRRTEDSGMQRQTSLEAPGVEGFGYTDQRGGQRWALAVGGGSGSSHRGPDGLSFLSLWVC